MEFPFHHLSLPSLQHLSISCHSSGATDTVSILLENIVKYRQTLKSIYFSEKGFFHRIGIFPAWSELPKLEELALEINGEPVFDSLPPLHPLRRIVVQQWSVDVISSWLDSTNMRHIRLLNGSKEFETDLYGGSLDNEAEMDRLFAKAKMRGISLEVSVNQKKLAAPRIVTKRLACSDPEW
jgi:hypothetical protein